jgi:hypothetical protein
MNKNFPVNIWLLFIYFGCDGPIETTHFKEKEKLVRQPS